MTVYEAADKLGLQAVNREPDRPLTGVYCCDLMSVAMSRAKAGDAWVTVMGNINAVAVASLADVSCVVLAEGFAFDAAALEAAAGKVSLLRSERPVYETAAAIGALL